MLFIALAALVALCGYLITPDNTPDANDQVASVALQKPGFKVEMLKAQKNQALPEASWLQKWWGGAPNPYEMIPLKGHRVLGDTIEVEEWKAGGGGRLRYFHVVDVVYAIQPESPIFHEKGKYRFTALSGKETTVDEGAVWAAFKGELFFVRSYPLGTDPLGRCIFSRLVIGARVSLAVGLVAVLLSLLIGVTLGASAGYWGGRVDAAVMFMANTLWAIPTLLLVFAIVMGFGRGPWVIYIAVGLTLWVETARLVRGQIMSLRKAEFVEAARALGFGNARIVFKHLLPNIFGPVFILAAANFATAILIESGLSYLGFGIAPPTPSWGGMLNECRGYLTTDKAFLALLPGICIALLVLAFTLLGNALRDAIDVKQ